MAAAVGESLGVSRWRAVDQDDVGFGRLTGDGLDRVRFVAPVAVGDEVRLRARLLAVDEEDLGTKVRLHLEFERRVDEAVACAAEWLGLYLR